MINLSKSSVASRKKKRNLKNPPSKATRIVWAEISSTSPRTKERRNKRLRGDVWILILTVILAGFGVVAIYSASRYVAKTQYDDEWYFVKKQLIGFVLGLAVMLFCSKLNPQCLRGKKVRWIALILPVALLISVFIPGVGKTNYGATRWIGIGGITLQPSELAKYGFVIFSAAYMAENMGRIRTFKGVLPVLIAGGVVCGLIILEPNMSVTMCVGLLMLSMLFLGGMKIKHFMIIFIPVLLVVPIMIIAEPYRMSRLSAFLNPWENPRGEGYQLIQSLYALGNGGWFGTGLFRSRQKYRFLPFAESDFILSIIGEEFGFFGIIVLFGCSFFLVYRGIRIASRTENFFSMLLSSGITMVYGIQTVLNALVVSGSIPPTGLPLPLISAGNTSLIVTMASMGILYAVSVQNETKTQSGGLFSYNKT